MTQLSTALKNHKGFAGIILNPKPRKWLDFSAGNKDLLQRDLSDTKEFSTYIFQELLINEAFVGVGGYQENRVIYRQLAHFTEEENPRCIHLGMDLWSLAGENIYAPLDGAIHSFAFNNRFGDYGPTIIIEHKLGELTFYTLYGHLSPESLDGLFKGKRIYEGEKFAEIGNYPTNGDWPPHLHFQVISVMNGQSGDFPGVCSVKDMEFYLSICPDPNLILRIGRNG